MADVTIETTEVQSPNASVRVLVARPRGVAGRLPALVVWSDIFQLTGPHQRIVRRLASHGFLVVAPELYARIEPPGTVLDFDADRQRALDAAARVELSWIDEERRAVLEYLKGRPDVAPDRLGACGFCFGGHVALRAACEPEIKASACFYPTGVHDNTLGAARGTADTLERVGAVQGELLLLWGRRDPHIPAAGRARIHAALDAHGVRFETRLFDAEHAFVRDEGPRWDPEAADRAMGATVDLFRRTLGNRFS